MAVKIDSVGWGEIVVAGEKFFQAMIVEGKAISRDHEKLEKLFGTTHALADWEEKKLLKGDPEVIIIGDGFDSVLKVNPEAKARLEKAGAEVKILETKKAVEDYNRLVDEGKKVNALIHTTC